jgi:hypothetical protein
MLRYLTFIFFIALTGSIFIVPTGCVKDPELPFNPYDTLTYPTYQIPQISIDSASFLGLHNYVFSKSCNVPGCHDGSFEPDFRTVQSSYNTLVRHGIVKNYPTNPLEYRVYPGDKTKSMLWKRVSEHNPPNFESMPSSGNQLPQKVLDNIAAWIDNGAKDIYGVNPTQSSLQPSGLGLLAYLPASSNQRIDTVRGGQPYQPFLAPANASIDLYFCYLEETTTGDTIFGNLLTVNQIKFSKNPFDFSNAVAANLTLSPLTPLLSSFAFSFINVGFPLQYTHKVTINPTSLGFQAGDIVYIRTYVKDNDHATATEIPQSSTQAPIILYYSMVLQ